ncbi:AIPR family protein [Bifidobacterium choloepi]|uniref:AIPR family protein n=1 Tax=Bifidobacterium choloepi TaxID=2614131 RepID=A0A6I5NF14_9BIFI|nr:AIPR family protein [Bifidobacterium choloepi]NEG69934.1 AIPR family protein [Bifidobacterium choloepi]
MADVTPLEQFAEELFHEVTSESDSKGIWKEEAFFWYTTDLLIDTGEINDAEYAPYASLDGRVRVDGYCGDPLESRSTADPSEPLTLGLIILDFHQGNDLEKLNARDMNSRFQRLMRFLEKARDTSWRRSLTPTDPAFGLAEMISTRWNQISKISLYLVTNKELSSRVDGKSAGLYEGKTIAYSVWDLRRLAALVSASGEREPLEVRFDQKPLEPVKTLLASAPDSDNDVYLAAIPGEDLARIYDRWGARLLEQNVRVFLQARSKVNKGIRNTLLYQPGMFFSFNNGITATAEQIETKQTPEGLKILALDNLQIVNGGQTTASIHAAYRAGKDLSQVFVQMKLSIIEPKEAKSLVPLISEYANSQNAVSKADLFSNHPFHTKIEGFSRRILAPAKEGSFTQTKWFYERARGQYNDAQAYLSSAEKRKFLEEYPKNQRFDKTQLAKYEMSWTDRPNFVNRGAQKNFAEFARIVDSQWEKDDLQFNEMYFKTLVAKKIVWDATEHQVPRMEWYEIGGYRAQHVAFTIGLLAHAAKSQGKQVNFGAIWQNQGIDESFTHAIEQAADVVHDVLMHPAPGYRNISEWAKQEKCWARIKEADVVWDSVWLAKLVSPEELYQERQQSRRQQREDTGIENVRTVVNAGTTFWKEVENWLRAEAEGSEKERNCIHLAAQGKVLTDHQSKVVLGCLQRLESVGCPYRLDA